MLVDLHSHYPMHVLAQDPSETTVKRMGHVREQHGFLARLRAAVLRVAAVLLNYSRFDGTWRVTLDELVDGDVGVVCSVLYMPFSEIDLTECYGARPEDEYFTQLVAHLGDVNEELLRIDPGASRHQVVTTRTALDDTVAEGKLAVVHCVEGGFHLGGDKDQIAARIADLHDLGVVYITLAHLFYRQVAANAPALPFLPDWLYNRVFPQKAGIALSDLGRAAVDAMYEQRMLIDLSHMRPDAIDATFARLAELDEASGRQPKETPIISSHACFRFGRQVYNHDEQAVRRIAERDGVIGLIFAQHQLNDGLRCRLRKTKDLPQSMAILKRHIDKIHAITGTYDHIAIGTDLDGFIKPTIGGVEDAGDLAAFQDALRAAYPDDADAMLKDNALRVLRAGLPAGP